MYPIFTMKLSQIDPTSSIIIRYQGYSDCLAWKVYTNKHPFWIYLIDICMLWFAGRRSLTRVVGPGGMSRSVSESQSVGEFLHRIWWTVFSGKESLTRFFTFSFFTNLLLLILKKLSIYIYKSLNNIKPTGVSHNTHLQFSQGVPSIQSYQLFLLISWFLSIKSYYQLILEHQLFLSHPPFWQISWVLEHQKLYLISLFGHKKKPL